MPAPALEPPAGAAAGGLAGALRAGGLAGLLGATGPGTSDLGAGGLSTSGPGASDLGTGALSTGGLGTSGPGTSDLGTGALGTGALGTSGPRTTMPGAGGLGAGEVGTGGLFSGGGTVAGPTPAAVLSRLATDPRLGWWLWRAALSAVTGTAMTALTSWRVGVTAAILTAIADTLLRARTSAAIPAPVRLGSAQRKTRRRLGRLAPSGYLALHGRVVPGTAAVIDHLVVGPAGVFAVHSERWDRRLPVRATRGGELCHGPYPQAGRLQAVCWEAGQASRLLTAELGEPVTVRAAMVIYGPPVPWTVMRIAGVDVFPGRRLRKYLRRETAASRAHRLSERHIELIHAAAARVLPPAR